MRSALVLALFLVPLPMPVPAFAQDAGESSGVVTKAKHVYESLFTKTVRLSLEPIAPTSGLFAGVALRPAPWRSPTMLRIVSARASVSANKYWAVDGSVAFQGSGEHEWRIEPYARFRSMKRLNHFGLGNDSVAGNRVGFAMLDRRVGVYGYRRPVGWLAVGGRLEGLWPRTDSGQNPDLPSIETLDRHERPGFGEPTNFVYAGGFVSINYPYVRSERPRRGGDYLISLGSYRDRSGTGHSFLRLELEGHERFPVAGVDRVLTVHGRLSSSRPASASSVPFYLMDTLGGADNLRGFRESIIGGDEGTATLRSFENFRFRDRATALFRIDFRQRLWSQIFASVFADFGVVGPSIASLSLDNVHRGVGVGLSVFRTNVLAVRVEFSVWGGEGHPRYLTVGRGLQF